MLKKLTIILLLIMLPMAVFADEPLINGTFDENIDGWAANINNTPYLSFAPDMGMEGGALKAEYSQSWSGFYTSVDSVVRQGGAGKYIAKAYVNFENRSGATLRIRLKDGAASAAKDKFKSEGTKTVQGEYTLIECIFDIEQSDYDTFKNFCMDIYPFGGADAKAGDVIYVDNVSFEKIPPFEVVSYTPNDIGTDVNTKSVEINFSNALDKSTVSAISLFENGVEIEEERILSDDGKTVTLNIEKGVLAKDSNYSVKITDALKDTYMQKIEPISLNFSTKTVYIADFNYNEASGAISVETFLSNISSESVNATLIIYAEQNGKYLGFGSSSVCVEPNELDKPINAEFYLPEGIADFKAKAFIIDNFDSMNIISTQKELN